MFFARRLYADLVTNDGTVVAMHLTWLRMSGFSSSQAMVEIHRPDGSRRVVHGHGTGTAPEREPDGGYRYRVISPDGQLFTLWHRDSASWLPRIAVAPHLSWQVSVAGAPVTFFENGRTLTGRGYADQVELTRPPRLLGLRRLQLGRIHLPDRAVVFGEVELAGERWTQVSDWNGARLRFGEEAPNPSGRGLRVPAPRGEVRLEPLRVLYAGDALAQERVPHAATRLASRLTNGAATETRWVSRAVPADDGPAGMAVHEVIHFGRRTTQEGVAQG